MTRATLTNTTQTADIIQFPSSGSSSSSIQSDDERQIGNEKFSDHQLKALVDSAVMRAYLELKSDSLGQHDGPYDPIYIAALKMDVISDQDIHSIIRYGTIEDRSADIQFEDGLDN